MKKTKAVILERVGDNYYVLTEDGSFRAVRLTAGKEVGAEIELREGRLNWRTWMSAVALFLLVITAAFTWFNHKQPTTVALLSLDINPSVELKLDAKSLVQDAVGLNADGQLLLKDVPVNGKQSQEALNLLVKRAIQLHYLTAEHPWVVLGASPAGTAAIPLGGLADAVTEVGKEQGLSVNVAAFQLTAGQENEAKAKGLSLGEYGLWLSAQKAGMSVPEQAVKNAAERTKLLSEKPVQAQVEAEKGTLKLGPSVLEPVEKPGANGAAEKAQDTKQQDVDKKDSGTTGTEAPEKDQESRKEHESNTAVPQGQNSKPSLVIPVFKGNPEQGNPEQGNSKQGSPGKGSQGQGSFGGGSFNEKSATDREYGNGHDSGGKDGEDQENAEAHGSGKRPELGE